MIDSQIITAALADVFGFHKFYPHQEEIVRAILSGRDAFAVMPTGGGKSLCYQLPAHILDGVCVVVSPLISLMKDQVDAARANGLRAVTLNSSITPAERFEANSALSRGELDLLYVSPERFGVPEFRERLQSVNVSFFAIDEAHCISEWGHDFRPDYLSLSRIVREFEGVPVAAFTATATPKVSDDIVERLRLREPHLTRASFNRPNLFYQVTPKYDFDRQLVAYIRERDGESGIIYRTTRKSVESTAAMLCRNGIPARGYHAGLPDEERSDVQDAFQKDISPIIVATIAFGMGIDKSNVRFVVHGDLPKNLEGYYQETGRAGRDGAPAHCALFFSRADAAKIIHFLNDIEDEQARESASNQLRHMLKFAEFDGCRRAALLGYFGEQFGEENCGGCDICTGEVEREDATVEAQKAMSAIVRTEGRFGATHVADIVWGADTERIRQNRHNELPTYGVGKDRDKKYWKRLLDALLAQGLTEVFDPQYPTPSVTAEGWKVLRGERKFEMIKQAEKKKKAKKASRSSALGDGTYSDGLFEKLRAARTQRARQDNVPPYIVFSDKTLQEMAHFFPDTKERMLAINGVGQRKMAEYGAEFLDVIREYCEEHEDEIPDRTALDAVVEGNAVTQTQSESRRKNTVEKKTKTADEDFVDSPNDTELMTLKLIDQGLNLEGIAEARELKAGTIITHMEKLKKFGHSFEVEHFFDAVRFAMIKALFELEGDWRLKPVVEASEGEVGYDEARLARIFLVDND